MANRYKEIVKHIPSLEKHGHLYMYYGEPYNEDCLVYGESEDRDNLVLSQECDELCRTIVDEFESQDDWLDTLDDHQIKLEHIFDVDVEDLSFTVVVALLLYLVESMSFEDKFIDALHNGYLVLLIKMLNNDSTH